MTTPVFLFNGTRQVSQGTGFFFASQTMSGEIETVFLVTNFHVVTGYSPGTNSTRRGDRIVFYLHEDKEDLPRVRTVQLPLYTPAGAPVWTQSDIHPDADVVLVPLPQKTWEGINLYVFTEAHTKGDIKIRPTSGAALLGYPFGFSDNVNKLPVWKTGHIATEPSVDFQGKPAFLVDVSAFPGMSGAPVLAVGSGIYEGEDEVMRSGRVLKLLGVFAAMPTVRDRRARDGAMPVDTQNTSPDAPASPDVSLQLGYVWKAALVADLAKAYRPR